MLSSLEETHFRFKDTNNLKADDLKIYHANRNHTRTREAMLITDEINLKTKHIIKEKERFL